MNPVDKKRLRTHLKVYRPRLITVQPAAEFVAHACEWDRSVFGKEQCLHDVDLGRAFVGLHKADKRLDIGTSPLDRFTVAF